jgi:hypothetical protein
MSDRVDLDVEVYPDVDPPWLHLTIGFPLERAEKVFKEIGTVEWANQMIDGLRACRAAESMGVMSTEREFKIGDIHFG